MAKYRKELNKLDATGKDVMDTFDKLLVSTYLSTLNILLLEKKYH